MNVFVWRSGVYIAMFLCLDRAGPWQTYPGQAEVLRERAEGKSERGEEGQGDEKEETQLFGQHEVSGGTFHLAAHSQSTCKPF